MARFTFLAAIPHTTFPNHHTNFIPTCIGAMRAWPLATPLTPFSILPIVYPLLKPISHYLSLSTFSLSHPPCMSTKPLCSLHSHVCNNHRAWPYPFLMSILCPCVSPFPFLTRCFLSLHHVMHPFFFKCLSNPFLPLLYGYMWPHQCPFHHPSALHACRFTTHPLHSLLISSSRTFLWMFHFLSPS